MRLATLVCVAIMARYVAEVLFHHEVLGGALLAVGLSAPILLRRLGPVASRLGTLMALPFIGVLTTPVVAAPAAHDAWWAPVVAVVAYVWVVAVTTVAHRLGLLHEAPPAPNDGGPDGCSTQVPAWRSRCWSRSASPCWWVISCSTSTGRGSSSRRSS